jgi:large subunit ribosomal protein L21
VKKAVIATGGKQYIVSEGDLLDIELIQDEKVTEFDVMLLIDGETIKIGTPLVKDVKVKAEIVNQNVKADKVMAIRYKAKKRVHKVRGHRQQHTQIKIVKIA